MQGGAPGATALLAGDIQALPANASTVASNLKAGKMRALAMFGEERDPAFPDVPSAKEQGYAVFGSPFVGVAVAKGVPQAAIDKLRAVVAKVAADKDFQEKALKTSTDISYLPAQKFGEVWARDWKTYEPMLKGK
jgi:tripartite-type tricarboxylate transporter receptor subunit TctC